MNEIKNNILNKIKEGEIHRESRWRFMAHDYFFWTLSSLTLVLGGIAVSVTLVSIKRSYEPLRPYMREPEGVMTFILTLPYIWLVLVAIFIIAAWFNYKKTTRSYRRHNGVIVLAVILLSILFGIGLFAAGVGERTDREMRDRIQILQKRADMRERVRDAYIEKRKSRTGVEPRPPRRIIDTPPEPQS